MQVPTMRVRWPDQYGDQVVVINESDFDPTRHAAVDAEGNEIGVRADPAALVYSEIQTMHEEDPDKSNSDWWRNDEVPELKELRRRIPNVSITGALRDDAYSKYLADNA